MSLTVSKLYRTALALSITGAVLLVIAIALPLVFPKLFESKLNKKLIIQPDSEMLERYTNTPIKIDFQIWYFNITNADDVINGSKPILQQVGPYTFQQQRRKVNIRWDEDLGTIRFNPKTTYTFIRSRSVGPLSDQITTINPIFTTTAKKYDGDDMKMSNKIVSKLFILRFLKDLQPFMTHSVGELSFEGYEAPILLSLYQITGKPAHKLGRAGFFYNKNATTLDDIEVFTGQKGMKNYQYIHRYNNHTRLNYWGSDKCNKIVGTDGSQFPRPVTGDEINLYTDQLCRSIYLKYEKNVKLGPMELRRYTLPKSLLENTDENKCYCSSNFTCRSGMVDVSPCRGGAPVLLSTPHFYQGDENDQTAVEGLSPEKNEHETYIDVEPTIGIAMRVAKRIQLNMALQRSPNFHKLLKVPELIIPVLWINESVVFPMDKVELLHRTLTLPLIVVAYGSWALLIIGLILIFSALCITYSTYKKNKKLQKRRQEMRDKHAYPQNKAGHISLLDKKLYEVS